LPASIHTQDKPLGGRKVPEEIKIRDGHNRVINSGTIINLSLWEHLCVVQASLKVELHSKSKKLLNSK